MGMEWTCRRAGVAWVALAAALPGPGAAQSAEEIARAGEHVQAAFRAREGGDLPGYLDGLERAEALRPGHPDLLYFMAGARALNGDADGAVALLDRVAAMGLGLRADDDPDFDALADDPAFRSVLERIRSNRVPVGRSRTAFVIPGESDFIPEGLAYDPVERSFYVGSVHKRTILEVDSAGRVIPFAERGFGGLMSAMGMVVDAPRRALWVASAGVPETGGLGPELQGRSAVFKFSLETRDLELQFHFADQEQERVLGDLVLADDGDVYVSDARGAGIYRIRAGGDFLETFVQPSVFRSPQGLALSGDQRYLYVADYSKGVFRVHRLTRETTRLEPPENTTLLGIDGLVRDGDALVAVQNGTAPHRILRLELDPEGKAIEAVTVLASNLTEWDEPTLGLMIDDRFYYVANSQWNRFVDGRLPEPEALQDPRIMWLDPRPTR